MSAACSHNRDDDQIKADIDKYGLSVIMVPGTDYLPAFAYSIGLWRNYQHPEVICFGMTVKTLGALINDVADLVKEGKAMETGKNYDDFLENCPMQFLSVDRESYPDYFGTALDIYDSDDFPALQLVWPDRQHQFPWHADFDKAYQHDQPLLDRNAHFKFREATNLATFTTQQWIDDRKPIIHVIHDTDGDWQFFTDDEYTVDNIKMVALGELIKSDLTLNQVFDLDYGEQATRKHLGGKWTRSKFEYDDEEPNSQ